MSNKIKKTKVKSMTKRVKERRFALSKTVTLLQSNQTPGDDDIESIDADSGSEMEQIGDELEDFHTYCLKPDFLGHDMSFYHTAASCYRLVGLKVYHPTANELHQRIQEMCSISDDTALSAIIDEIIHIRDLRDVPSKCPQFLQMAEEWVRIAIRDDDQEMPEAYRALGMLYKLSVNEVTERWLSSGVQDTHNLKIEVQKLGLSQSELDTLQTGLDTLHEEFQYRRDAELTREARLVFSMLDGVAEEEAESPLPATVNSSELMDQYITKHSLACVQQARTWVQVAQLDSDKKQTPSHAIRGTTDAYEALPALSTRPTVLPRTLQDFMTTEEREKAENCLIKQRGRQHALNPPIAETQWPDGESSEVTTSRKEKIKQLTKYDSTVFLSRVVQIMGIKKPVVTQQDLEATPQLTVKDKIRRELQTCITKAGHPDLGPIESATYDDNHWKLDEDWFDRNWSTLFNRSDGAFQTETIYMVLTNRMYFGTVGTFATKQLDTRNKLIAYGKQGSGRVIFSMCQMVTSDYCYTESTKREATKKYYWHYWLVGMDTSCKIENLFRSKTGPLLAVFRGLHAEADQQTALAVQMLAIKQYALDIGLLPEEFGLILEQDWHAGKVYADGRQVPMTRDDPDYWAKSQNNRSLFEKRGFRVERATEMVVCLKYVAESKGHDVTTNTAFKTSKARILEDFQTSGSYVNLSGLRMERFPSYVEMQKQRIHAPEADEPHTIVIDNVRPHILASDVVEELLADPTHTNWSTIPNATMVYYQPPSAYPWARKGARIVVVFRHEIPPVPLDESKFISESQRMEAYNAQLVYSQRTDHTLELSGIIAKYSAPTMGGAFSTLEEVDCRSKYIDLGRRYALAQDSRLPANTSSPISSPLRKKLKKQGTPENNKVSIRTPSTGSSVSSMLSSASVGTGVEKYKRGAGEMGELVNTISRLSAEVTALRVTQETQAKANDSRHTATENKLKMVETTISNVEKTIASSTLKAILRNIRDEANKLQSMTREHAIYVRQLSEAGRDGTYDRRMELQGKIEIVDNQIQSLRQSLDGLREDAKEQAEQDSMELTEAQLRNDV